MKRITLVGAAICVVGLALLTVRAEVAVRTGPQFEIPISGYDPRDILRGQYLMYQYQFRWEGSHTCERYGGSFGAEPAPEVGCCLCFSAGADGYDPPTRQVECDEVSSCDGWVRSESMSPPLRYFVPEEKAADLEGALRERPASIRLRTSKTGEPAVEDLLIDRLPWREALGEH